MRGTLYDTVIVVQIHFYVGQIVSQPNFYVQDIMFTCVSVSSLRSRLCYFSNFLSFTFMTNTGFGISILTLVLFSLQYKINGVRNRVRHGSRAMKNSKASLDDIIEGFGDHVIVL